MKPFIALTLSITALSTAGMASDSAAARLSQALRQENPELIAAAVEAGRAALGDDAGMPEEPDEYKQVPADARLLTADEAYRAMGPQFPRIERMKFWKIGVDPTQLSAPLRGPASIIGCMLAVNRAQLQGAEQALPIAEEAAEFLLWAQQEAGAGCYPFPAAKGTSSARAMEVATRFLERAESAGKLSETVRNGWAFEDHGDGGLQFDNAECGVAILELFEATKNPRYLKSARQAADWACGRPLCPNWNYNAFSVHLLAKTYAVTGDTRYRDAALKKALLGVIPGQLTTGPRAGRWMDPHNARPAYHYIMMSALAQLGAVLPAGHPDRPTVLRALTLGLQARNQEILTLGVMNKDKAIECLLLTERLFASDPAFRQQTQSTAALDSLLRYASEEARRGKLPVGPRGWGEMLERLRADG
jgi:hypothetical protein